MEGHSRFYVTIHRFWQMSAQFKDILSNQILPLLIFRKSKTSILL